MYSDDGNPTEGSSSQSSYFECDIGKLLSSHVDLQQLSRHEKYQLLRTEPNSDPSVYSRTRPYPSSSFRQFQPSWMKQYPWLHYSQFADGVFCRACACGMVLGQFVTAPFRT